MPSNLRVLSAHEEESRRKDHFFTGHFSSIISTKEKITLIQEAATKKIVKYDPYIVVLLWQSDLKHRIFDVEAEVVPTATCRFKRFPSISMRDKGSKVVYDAVSIEIWT